MAKKSSKKYSFMNEVCEGIEKAATVTRSGDVRLKRADLKKVLETAFQKGCTLAAGGERVRFPVVGALVRRDVKAIKGGEKKINPFTGEPMVTKSRAASKKPRWSFPKSLKEVFANKKYW